MKTNETTTKAQKQMKMAEAAVLFILVLGMTVFVGMRFAPSNDISEIQSPAAAVQTVAMEDEAFEAPMAFEEASVDFAVAIADTVEEKPAQVITYASAKEAYANGNFEEASFQFAVYTEDRPGNAWGYYMLALSEMKAGNGEGSEFAFKAALDIKPDHVKSLVNYSRLLLTLDRTNDARTQVESALVADPDNAAAHRVMGRVCHNLQQLEDAKAAYMTALRIKSNDAWSLNNLGLILIEQGEYEDAIAPLAKATSLKTDVACFHNNLGVALEKVGQYKAASEAYAGAITADSNYAKAEISLARVETLEDAYDTVSIDLIALAASFTAETAVAIQEEVQDEESADVEIATAMIVAELVETETISEQENSDK